MLNIAWGFDYEENVKDVLNIIDGVVCKVICHDDSRIVFEGEIPEMTENLLREKYDFSIEELEEYLNVCNCSDSFMFNKVDFDVVEAIERLSKGKKNESYFKSLPKQVECIFTKCIDLINMEIKEMILEHIQKSLGDYAKLDINEMKWH